MNSPAHRWPGHDPFPTLKPEPPPPELEVIVLPCRHAVERPNTLYAEIECVCGRKWKLTQDHGGQAWAAEEVHA